MKYLAIAYPEISGKDYQLIQDHRKQYDELHYKIVEPHFTFVFAVGNISQEDFIREIKKQLNNQKAINFVIRCAAVSKDSFSEYYHTFLVPDEGYSQIVKLHDKLYNDKLKNELRLDIDFIPHIGIGNSLDKLNCKSMSVNWNKTDFEIKGAINSMDVVSYENAHINTIEKIILR